MLRRAFLLSACVLAAPCQAQATPPALQRIAREVAALDNGLANYGEDCVWRTDRVLERVEALGLHARPVSVSSLGRYGYGFHRIALVTETDATLWVVDGQSGEVALLDPRTLRAGRYFLDGQRRAYLNNR